MAVQRVVGAFLDHLTVERGASEHTVAGYRRDLARYREFLDEWGRADLAEVTEADVAAWTPDLVSEEKGEWSEESIGQWSKSDKVLRKKVRLAQRFARERGAGDETAGDER